MSDSVEIDGLAVKKVEDIDWNEVWKSGMLENQSSKNRVECSRVWERKDDAKRYESMVKRNNWEYAQETIEGLDISPNSRVLDIGAGPGTLAIPLSEKVEHITAIEPSEGMMWCLKENIKERGISNITCVKKRWGDVDLEKDVSSPYDAVIASFSLGMLDIRNALEKMNKASYKYVCIYWFAGITSWERNYSVIWKKLHGEDYHPRPKCDCLFNVLYQMGIYPNVKIYPTDNANRFLDIKEAMDYFKTGFNVTNKRQEGILREYLSSKLHREDGYLVLKGSSNYAKIWWKKQ